MSDKEKEMETAAAGENAGENAADCAEQDKETEKNSENAEKTDAKAAKKAAKEKKKDAEEKLKKELDEQKDKYLRLMAEYDNYRKRTAKQQLDTREAAVGDTVLEFIKVYDNLERAMETQTADEHYKAGIEMIYKQFTDALEKLKVSVIDPTGETFDPATANAVSQIEDPELGENVVAQVFEKGVRIGEKLIRYPVVVVANP